RAPAQAGAQALRHGTVRSGPSTLAQRLLRGSRVARHAHGLARCETLPMRNNYRLESRMRENRPCGSEGGEGGTPFRPLSGRGRDVKSGTTMAGRFSAKRSAAPEFVAIEEPASPTLEAVSWTVFPDPSSELVLPAPEVNPLHSDKLLDAKIRLHRRL